MDTHNKVLILGGNGFVGKAIAKKFLDEGSLVYVYNRGTIKNLDGVIHLKGSRNDEKKFKELIEDHRFNVVIDVSSYVKEQLNITLSNLKARCDKYIYISSASVYRDVNKGIVDESSVVGIGLDSWGTYGYNKYYCEELLKEYSKKTNMNYIIFRPFYIYGKGNNLDRESYFLNRIYNGKTIYIPSEEVRVQFGYIEDLVNCIYKASNDERFNNNTYNISGREYLTFKEMIDVMGDLLDIAPKIEKIDTKISGLKAREWFPFREVNLCGSINKLSSLGIEPKYSYKEGIEEYLKSFQFNNKYPITEVEKNFK